MPNQAFEWAGIDKQGHRVNGVIQVAELSDARTELKKRNVEVISIKPKKQITFSFKRKNKIKQKDILLFTRYLSTMITAGLPIIQALDIISRDQSNLAMQEFVNTMRSNVAQGKTLAESFKQYPEHFNDLYCNLIKAGERSGTIDKILLRLATYLEKTEALKRKIKKAMIYPAVVLIVALVVSMVLLLFVVPHFQTIFESFGAKLPLFTRIVISISNSIRTYWWLLLGVVVLSVFGARHIIKSKESVREAIDRYVLKMYIIGPLLTKSVIARYTRTLAITLDAGMPIIDAMKSMSDIMGNILYKKAVLKICTDVTSGIQLNVAMSDTHLFPNMVVQMTAVGEASGSLSDMLGRIADYYEDEVNSIVDNLSSLLEPLIMVLLGIIIGGFVIAMYLPIFKLGSLF